MDPYTGRTGTQPDQVVTAPHRTWPIIVALVALVVFGIVGPIFSFAKAMDDINFLGGTFLTPEQQQAQYGWLLTGFLLGLVGLILGLVAAVFGRGTARGVAITAIVVSVLASGALGASAFGASRMLQYPAPPLPPAASCGPDSQPVVFGGDSRYTACAEDLANAQTFADDAIAQLPSDEVTVASVDAIASGITNTGNPDERINAGTVEVEPGVVVTTWVPAPVACAFATWRDGAWSSSVDGMLVEGGCVYTGG